MAEESTTPDPVELTHRVYAALNDRDLDAFVGLLSPASLVDGSRYDLGTHKGPVAIRRFCEDWFGKLREYRVQVEEMHNVGNGVVYVVQLGHRGRGPHTYVELQAAVVFAWADDMLARVMIYPEIDEARAAAERLAGERR